MRIVHAGGIEGARRAHGLVVVIDVLRAFSVSAHALAAGATECLLVAEIEEARALARARPGSVISAEIGGLPIRGIPISNSPTQVRELDLTGRVLIQRSSAGTQCTAAAAAAGSEVLAASLVVAAATARRIAALDPPQVTLLASGADHDSPEDEACGFYIASLVQGLDADLEQLLRPFFESARCRRIRSGAIAGFPPSDLDLSLAADRFDFAMPVLAAGRHQTLRRLAC